SARSTVAIPASGICRRTNSMSEAVPLDFNLERFGGYLLFLTQLLWDTRLQAKLEPLDLVQKTLTQAHEKRSQFRGTTEAELKGWLRRIHANNLAVAFRRQKPERSLEEMLEQSSSRLEGFLAADQSSPSERAAKNEELTRLADSLAKLSALQ